MQWWLPKEAPRPSGWAGTEIEARLSQFSRLRDRAVKVAKELPAAKQDGYFQLVGYPVIGATEANTRYFGGELAALTSLGGHA
ncbi:MAG: hypothetical protein QM760_17615 [Nibricoccus sp.]